MDSIISTLRFFDLQGVPITLFEVHKFLIAPSAVSANEIFAGLQTLQQEGKVAEKFGYYCLPGKEKLIDGRLSNYEHGIVREKLIKKYSRFLGYIPFVRSIALAGSQALGQEKPGSDIDLFIITTPGRMWTARTFVTAYFHVLRKRRHGKFISNRFCLNHYVAGEKLLTEGHSLYTAMEYAKLRPLVNFDSAAKFSKNNLAWIKTFFPNVDMQYAGKNERPVGLQAIFEKIFSGSLGEWMENYLRELQKKRIHTDQYVRVLEDELSFHPDSKEQRLLADFFELEQKQERKTV